MERHVNFRPIRRLTCCVATLLLVLAAVACGGSDDAATGGEPEAAVGDETASAEALPAFTVAFPSVIGVSHLPLVAAIDELRAQGYEIETPFLAESELSVEGAASGEFQFSHGTSQSTMLVVQQGAPLVWLTERVANEWTLFARNDITSCEDLDGRRTAIHSEGAVSTAMVRAWIEDTCPGTEPQYVVIPGSPNRAQALLSDQIDVSPVELSEAVGLERDAGDRFGILTNFSTDLPDLVAATLYVRQDFADEYPEAVGELVQRQLEQNQRVAEEDGYLAELIREYIPEFEEDLIEPVATAYVDGEMFPVDGGLTEDSVQFTIDFFTDAGVVEPGLTPSEIWDPSFVE